MVWSAWIGTTRGREWNRKNMAYQIWKWQIKFDFVWNILSRQFLNVPYENLIEYPTVQNESYS